MNKILSAILFLVFFLAGTVTYADCRVIDGDPRPSTDFVNGFYQNQHANIWQHAEIECTGISNIEWIMQRDDPEGWQQKVDLLLDDLEANPRGIHVYVHIIPVNSPAQTIGQAHFDFGRKGPVAITHNTASTLAPGKYKVTISTSFNVTSPKTPLYSLIRNDKRLLFSVGGLRVTYAILFRPDPNIPICNPKYKYYVDRTNVMFDSSFSDFFDRGGSQQQDINFKVEREDDLSCNAEIVTPLIKIKGPVGPDVETPDITGTHIAELKNGTSLALYQLKDGAAESPMNYGSSHDLNVIGGVNGLQSSRKVRVKWAKTPGKSVKTGRWHATMKYELYFR